MQGESSTRRSRSMTQLSPQRRALSSRFPSASPSSGEESSVSTGIGAGHLRGRSCEYFRLPDSLLRLSVLKLDGSSFDVEITGDACVEELKVAIEEIFIQASPAEGENDNISWSDVWGHFCLCFNDHKLTDDEASLRTLGIKDGHQLHFIRHLSLNQFPEKRRTKSCVAELRLDMGDTELTSSGRKFQFLENGDGPKYVLLSDDLAERKSSKLGCFFKRLLSYSRLGSLQRAESERWSNAKSSRKGHRNGSKK